MFTSRARFLLALGDRASREVEPCIYSTLLERYLLVRGEADA